MNTQVVRAVREAAGVVLHELQQTDVEPVHFCLGAREGREVNVFDGDQLHRERLGQARTRILDGAEGSGRLLHGKGRVGFAHRLLTPDASGRILPYAEPTVRVVPISAATTDRRCRAPPATHGTRLPLSSPPQ